MMASGVPVAVEGRTRRTASAGPESPGLHQTGVRPLIDMMADNSRRRAADDGQCIVHQRLHAPFAVVAGS